MSLLHRMVFIVLTWLGTMLSWNWLYMAKTAGYAAVAMVSFLVFAGSFAYLAMNLWMDAPRARRHW